ncbi:four-helix bundle copper-binding protein [Galbibacter pacificus]|uniref:Four-helix bundle copper-binding protein n=1 Tax=Galbibacter pacificus TaxID=2996052 RepID=A0ABT6FSV8_9FLAO|nr:four-helix bundle copper-binding protein [Galbibacter pacificus]MDG3582529.1 four-helix bundle copper-binding protein [Galbibacter pacificus]MDG3586352.1 four-helix bundle copper-binding protein [Galbibacter pacificus]
MKNSKLIEALNNCVAHCNYCADACLDSDDIKMMVDCIRTDRACAEVCSATAKLLAANYSDAKEMVEYCHKTCKKCADECAKHDAQHCKDCADACKKCADACEAYLS